MARASAVWRTRELLKLALNVVQDVEVDILRRIGVIDFPVPPNSNMRRTSARSIKRYLYSALTTYSPIVTMARFYACKFDSQTKVLDFGCGGAGQLMPLVRHFPNAKYFACDVDPSSIQFVRENYSSVDAYANDFLPPLKYADGEMDIVYSVSTFSHFDAVTMQKWLAEIFRILKPGGYAFLSVEGRHAIPSLLTEMNIDADEIERVLNTEGFFYKEYWWLKQLQQRGPALNAKVEIAKYFGDTYGNTVMTPEFVRRTWPESGLVVLGIAEGVIAARQDLIVLQRPSIPDTVPRA
jgi:SAM-dependent methyltransferase